MKTYAGIIIGALVLGLAAYAEEGKSGCGAAKAAGCGAAKAAGCGAKAAGCGATPGACAITKPQAGADAAAAEKHSYGTVDTAALKGMVAAKTPMVLVDARTAKYDDGKRIPGAIWLPSDSSDEAITKALPAKDALVVAYCSNLQCPASKILAERLVKMGYANVLKYPDGLAGWSDAGLEVKEKSE